MLLLLLLPPPCVLDSSACPHNCSKYLTVFDRETARIGVALARHQHRTGPTPAHPEVEEPPSASAPVLHEHGHPPIVAGTPIHGFLSPDGNTAPEQSDTDNLFLQRRRQQAGSHLLASQDRSARRGV